MDWTFAYLLVGLKLPLLLLGWILWWATRPVASGDQGDGDGGIRRTGPRHPRPTLPRAPRRGPHGDPSPRPPARNRVAHTHARHPHSA